MAVGLLMLLIVVGSYASATKYRWRKGTITLSISTSIFSNTANISAGSDSVGAIDRSIAAWSQAASVSLRRSSTIEQNVSPSAQGDGISIVTIAGTPENVALFPDGLDDATARTRIFYDSRGFITEADIVLNPFLQFSTDGTVGTFDFESTVTHELGHLLGLDHSPVVGATMSDSYGKNGVYNLPAFSARTLAADDIAAARSLYGPADTNEECCGRVNGKLVFGGNKTSVAFSIWLEDADDGRVAAATTSAGDGSFRLGGLVPGKYHAYAQSDTDLRLSAVDLGSVLVTTKQPVNLSKKIDRVTGDFRFDFLGLNGQLAGMAIAVNAGNSYLLIAGSIGSSNEPAYLESNSDLISLQQGRNWGIFAKDIRTFGFETAIAPNTPLGEYSIFASTKSGFRRYMIGGLTVEKFPNVWSIATLRQ
jgi:hypothetical protein